VWAQYTRGASGEQEPTGESRPGYRGSVSRAAGTQSKAAALPHARHRVAHEGKARLRRLGGEGQPPPPGPAFTPAPPGAFENSHGREAVGPVVPPWSPSGRLSTRVAYSRIRANARTPLAMRTFPACPAATPLAASELLHRAAGILRNDKRLYKLQYRSDLQLPSVPGKMPIFHTGLRVPRNIFRRNSPGIGGYGRGSYEIMGNDFYANRPDYRSPFRAVDAPPPPGGEEHGAGSPLRKSRGTGRTRWQVLHRRRRFRLGACRNGARTNCGSSDPRLSAIPRQARVMPSILPAPQALRRSGEGGSFSVLPSTAHCPLLLPLPRRVRIPIRGEQAEERPGKVTQESRQGHIMTRRRSMVCGVRWRTTSSLDQYRDALPGSGLRMHRPRRLREPAGPGGMRERGGGSIR
jgi:hypothetical protein